MERSVLEMLSDRSSAPNSIQTMLRKDKDYYLFDFMAGSTNIKVHYSPPTLLEYGPEFTHSKKKK